MEGPLLGPLFFWLAPHLNRYNAEMKQYERRREAWSQYWATGAMHSLQGSLPDRYEGNVRKFWEEFFLPLGQDHRVLELGTGNGALPALMCELHPLGMPRVDAIDYASIAPKWLEDASPSCRESIAFHSNVLMESLPFAASVFDLVAGQFAFEYADRSAASREVVRVLKPGGMIALLLHASHSQLATVALAEAPLVDWLLQKGGFMETAAQIYRFAAIASTPDGRARLNVEPSAISARNSYNHAVRSLMELAASSSVPDLLIETRTLVAEWVADAARSGNEALARYRHAAYCRSLEESRLRSSELLTHALSEDAATALISEMRMAGLASAEVAPFFHENGALIGWSLRGRK